MSTIAAPPVAFAGSRLDRADHLRSDAQALARLAREGGRRLRLDGLEPVMTDAGALVWDAIGDVPESGEEVFLGQDGDRGCFATVPEGAGGGPPHPGPGMWQAMARLDPADLAIYGGARALVGWHARHRFCARCGHATALVKGGWQRTCRNPACRAEHFPRVDPVTIMLVEHDGDLLLGRQPRFPPRRFSALAGFVEPGETIEEAVAREVFEEAGVRVGPVRYVMSQPWPFPSSLMIGCCARALDRVITVDRTELDDARWFSRAEVAESMAAAARGDEEAGAFVAPPPMAVAHHLVAWWLSER